ncbi:MAG: 2OG-Fe(II) oxygenase [Halioglobus sp.]
MTDLKIVAECACGSGKPFETCCGIIDPSLWMENANGRLQMSPSDPAFQNIVKGEPRCSFDGVEMPKGLLVKILDDSRYHWKEIARHLLSKDESSKAKIRGQSGERVTSAIRVTQVVDQGKIAPAVTDLVKRLFRDEVQPHFRCKLKSLETPHVLRYTKGCYYLPHADSDEINVNTQRWEKRHDRDLSLLLYLDDDYEGGEIAFANFDFKLRPRAGMLFVFPSDFRYLHGAMPVSAGVRHAVVSWCSTTTSREMA